MGNNAVSVVSPDGTVVNLVHPTTNQHVTLIGTAHLSQASNDQVRSIITSIKPKVVMIELDESRLERINKTKEDLGFSVLTADDIVPPLEADDVRAMENVPFWRGFTELCLDKVADLARASLTSMYNDMGDSMNGLTGGGEFIAAIEAAQQNDLSSTGQETKIVLGDRSSVVTIKRAIELAIRSGNPLEVLGRLASANQEEMDAMQEKIEKENPDKDFGELNVVMVEVLKNDSGFRTRIFDRLEKDVPEFTRAFVTERDYVMAEAIRRESSGDVVAVVGLAHVPGIARNLGSDYDVQDTDVS